MTTTPWLPAPYAVFVTGVESGKPYRLRVGGYRTFEEARQGALDNERVVSGDRTFSGLVDFGPDPGGRSYQIYRATWEEV